MLESFQRFTKCCKKIDIQDNLLEMVVMFKALGDPTRLRIFEFLRSCAGEVAVDETGKVRPVLGPTVGEVCCKITGAEQINSRVSHHLKELRLAGLITVERRGKNMICGINPKALDKFQAYFNSNKEDCGECGIQNSENQKHKDLCQTRN